MTTQDYPWLHCNSSWNSPWCHPFFANGTQPALRWFFSNSNSANEFLASAYDFSTRNVISLLVVWVLVLLSLWKGPVSLVRSFQFYLPVAMVLNIFLFFCGVSLPGASAGIASLKDSGYSFDYYRLIYFFQLFYGISGRFLFLGRLVERKTFVLPYFYIAFGVIFVLQLLSVIKVAAFNGHFNGLFDADSVQAQSRYLRSYNHELICLSISLTKIPASTFWLMLQYLYLLCLELPYYSLTLEIVASSLAECVPYQSFPRLKILASRTNFPQNLILTGLLGLVGIVISICEMKLIYYESSFLVYNTYHVSFILIMAFIFIILPFSFMKTFLAIFLVCRTWFLFWQRL